MAKYPSFWKGSYIPGANRIGSMSGYLPPAGEEEPASYNGGPPPGYYTYPGPPGAGTIPAPPSRFWGPPGLAAPSTHWARWWNLWLARMCLLSCAFGALFALLAGAVTLALLTDPLFTQDTLSEAGSAFRSLLVLGVYFLIAGIFGLVLAGLTYRKVRLEHRVGAVLLLVLPGLIAVCTMGLLSLVPFARGILTSMPVIGAGLFARAAATSPFSGNDRSETGLFRWGAWLQMGMPLLMAGLFEALSGTAKVAGIAVIYPAFAFLSVLFIAQGSTAYALARRRWGPVFGRRAVAAGWPQDAAPAAPVPRGEAGRGPVLVPAALAVLALVFLAALAPAAHVLTTQPRLDIVKASGSYSMGKAAYSIQVVNRGGRAATGQIEVWLENATYRELAGAADRIDGYGLWKFSGNLTNSSITKSTLLYAVLYYKGEEQDRMTLRPPPVCLILPAMLPMALAGVALSGARRRRLRG